MAAMRSSEIDMLGAGVVVGLAAAGLVVVWLSSAGGFTVRERSFGAAVPLWLGQVTFGSAAVLVLLAGFCWWKLLP